MTLKEVAELYAGKELKPDRSVVPMSESKRVGKLYHELKHDPTNEKVQKAYTHLKAETLAQWEHLKKHGYTLEPSASPSASPPAYPNSTAMRDDVIRNRHLYFDPTQPEIMDASHPMAEVAPNGLKYNDMFRAIHDVFGHAVHGHQFGRIGEHRAWMDHKKMFSPDALPALTAETHGQNSWVNAGPHEPEKLPVLERPYAEQKAVALKLAAPVGATDFNGLVNHIAQNPHDSLGYLILADHLEESGHTEEAHKIRFVIRHQDPKPGEPIKAVVWPKHHDEEAPPDWPVFGHPIGAHHLRGTFTTGIGTHGDGIYFTTPEHHIRLLHEDPTDKLIQQFREHQVVSQEPLSAHEERKLVGHVKGGQGSRAERVKALQDLAFHHTHFGNRAVGLKLGKLLERRGLVFTYPTAEGHTHYVRERYAGHIMGQPHSLHIQKQPNGSPVRLSAMKAPAGGSISNNAFSKGGRFMANPLLPVRQVCRAIRGRKLRATQ